MVEESGGATTRWGKQTREASSGVRESSTVRGERLHVEAEDRKKARK